MNLIILKLYYSQVTEDLLGLRDSLESLDLWDQEVHREKWEILVHQENKERWVNQEEEAQE